MPEQFAELAEDCGTAGSPPPTRAGCYRCPARHSPAGRRSGARQPDWGGGAHNPARPTEHQGQKSSLRPCRRELFYAQKIPEARSIT